MTTHVFFGFFLGAAIGAVTSCVLTNYYKEKEIDWWKSLYHRCRVEMTRIYKQKDELWEKFKEEI